MSYVKNFGLSIGSRSIKIQLRTRSPLIVKLLSENLNLSKVKINNKSRLTISLNLEEISRFPFGRGDNFNTSKGNLSLNSWSKNIQVNVNTAKRLIVGNISMPTNLPKHVILGLAVIHPLRHILKYHNIFLIHTAVLAKRDKGILICGPAKSGKSTLSLKLIENGFKFVSDEFVAFDQKRLFPLFLKIGLEKSSLKIFPQLQRYIQKSKASYEKVSFDMQNIYPHCLIKSCSPKIIIFPAPKKKLKKFIMRALNKECAFSLLCMDKDNSLPFEQDLTIRQKQIQSLAILAEKTKAYVLSYGLDEINRAIKIINRLLI